MANLIMTNWRIQDKLPYINLGSAGENNASQIIITVDELIENAKYYLDIGDESGNGLPNTQELTPNTNDTIHTLTMKPLITWLGREGVKLLQVRCIYEENEEQVFKESNVFHGKVDRNSGFVYKYNIAVFEEYVDKIKNIAKQLLQKMALNCLSDVEITSPTDNQVLSYDAENEKWINKDFEGSDYVTTEVLNETLEPYVKDVSIKQGAGENSIIECNVETNKANSAYSHAEGSNTQARAVAAHAEGSNTIASGSASHAENKNTTSSGTYSHAEGDTSVASGNTSHAEGGNTVASGSFAHSEGSWSQAIGNNSHTEGQGCYAYGFAAHAQNDHTVARGQGQTTIGAFNVEQGSTTKADTDYALIIGNGTDNEHRSNALAIQWDGNVVFQDGSKQNSASISITDLKTLVASCSDFADFKTQIALL